MDILDTVLHADSAIEVQEGGAWALGFFKDAVGTPAFLVGLFAMLGAILLRKKGTDVLVTFFKTAAGFLIMGGGAGVLVGSLSAFGVLFEDLFGIAGVIPNNDAFAGWFFGSEAFGNIAQLGSIIMVVSMILNLLLAFTSRFKYVYLSGHVLFYMSIMLAGVMAFGGVDISGDNAGDYTVALISSSLFMALYMVLSCAMLRPFVEKITGQDNLSVAHTGALSYAMGGLIGDLIHKVKNGSGIRSTEDINFPQSLAFFRNTFISMAITMIGLFLIVYLPEGIMYSTGAKTIEAAPANLQAGLTGIFSSGSTNWLVKCFIDAFTFAAGVEIMLMGVRMIVGELVPSFKGISDKFIKGAKAGIDIPIVFPYAPNAVLIGFVASVVGAIAGLGISVGVTAIDDAIPVILPGIVAQFFLGAGTGVFGNARGGIWGCVIGAFLNGIIITIVPIIFYVGGWVPTGDDSKLVWGDTDYLLGVIPGLLAKISDHSVKLALLVVVPAVAYVALAIDGLVKTHVTDKKRAVAEQIQRNREASRK